MGEKKVRPVLFSGVRASGAPPEQKTGGPVVTDDATAARRSLASGTRAAITVVLWGYGRPGNEEIWRLGRVTERARRVAVASGWIAVKEEAWALEIVLPPALENALTALELMLGADKDRIGWRLRSARDD